MKGNERKTEKKRSGNKGISAAFTLAIILFVVSGAISIPLLFRSFYYSHIDWLDIEEKTGYEEVQIRESFDEMMDYCMGKTEEFGTGDLKWSAEGKSHFDDCKMLFTLDKIVLALGVVGAVILGAFIRARGDNTLKPARRAGIIMLALGAVIGALGAMDFDAFFVKFHHTFFPGKDNWLFDPAKDEIIKILPEEFFRNCAILIVSVIVIASILLIVLPTFKRERRGE